jgi:PAS domain-containing protein
LPAEVLEILVSEDGRYLDANQATFEVLGYTREELRALPFGTLAGISPEVAIPMWRRSIRESFALPTGAATHLVSREGDLHAVVYLGVRPAEDPDEWYTRFRLVTRRRVAVNRPMILQWILAQWRDAERRLAALPQDAPERAELEEDLAELKALYAGEQARRGKGPAG